jgi:Transposase DDE domain group 1
VVTHLKQSPQWIYEEVYCQRGDVENRIKELHDGMQIGRTSCSNFWANTFRVVLTAAAYVLMREIRLPLAPTRYARAQVSTLRERFLKLGAQVVVSVRRIVLHLPHSFPDFDSVQTSCFQFRRSERVTAPPRRPREFLLVNLLLEVSSLLSQFSLGPSYRTQSFFRFNDFFESIAFGS